VISLWLLKKYRAAFRAQCHSERSEESSGITPQGLVLSKRILHFADSTGSGLEFIERVQNDKPRGILAAVLIKPF
jgi:hypothetical protein